jgi:hypothetical protein
VAKKSPEDEVADPGQSSLNPLKELAEAEVGVAFINVNSEGEVTGVDIYAVPQKEFEEMPPWETPSAYRRMCEQHRCISVDTHFVQEEGLLVSGLRNVVVEEGTSPPDPAEDAG